MRRRTFLLTAASAQSRILGANDRLRAGIIGAGGRGRYLIGQFKEACTEIGAVCDIYEPVYGEMPNWPECGGRPKS